MKKLIIAIILSTITVILGTPKTDIVLAGGSVVECPVCKPK